MFFTLFKLSAEPIYVVRIKFPLDHSLSNARFVWNRLNTLAAAQDDPLFVVFDLGNEPLGISDMLLWIDERRSNPMCMPRNPNLYILAAGTNPLLTVAAKKFLKMLGSSVKVFDTVEEALGVARQQHEICGSAV